LREKGFTAPAYVIPQFGVDPELFRPEDGKAASSDQPLSIGFAGRLVAEKGVDLLLNACARLRFPFRLTIIGEGPALAALRSHAADLGIQSQVTFAGGVRSTDMPGELRRLDTLVLPSLTRPNWTEQFGRVLVEAMACGVPVIGSRSGEIPAVIGEAGLTVPEADAGAIADALERLRADPALAADLARRGRERVLGNFTHQHIAGESVAVYRQWARPAPVS
jgi:glycosyltransferase involved in cell wall biosynthesis